MEDIASDEATRVDCGHCFCNNCWTEHFIVKINDGQSRRIRCMAHKCNSICDEAVVRNLVSKRHPDMAEKFDRFLLESYIEDNKRVKWCPSAPHCGNAIRIEDDEFCEVECSCGLQFCFSCLSEAHSPCSCLMWELWAKKCRDESETVNWITAHTKPCPKCHKHVEKNGGCNLVSCICGQSFCWLCGGATGRDHTWSSITGHSCGRFKAEREKKSERAKRDHDRYLHYFNRYRAHTDSFKQESKLKETIQERVSITEERDSRLRDFSWVNNGLSRLFRSRRVLSYSYPFAFYMFGDELFNDEMTKEENEIKQHLFEDQQQQLEGNVEKLSKLMEEPFDQFSEDKVMEIRMQVINLSVITDTLCQKLYDCIENDLLGSLEFGNHNIAPYKSKGIERASELIGCWKANNSDKYLASDHGTSELDRPSGSGSSDESGCSSRKRARKDGLGGGLFDLNLPAEQSQAAAAITTTKTTPFQGLHDRCFPPPPMLSSTVNHPTISITVSDEESEDRPRLLQARRKRRKQHSLSSRSKTKKDLLVRALRKVVRWWPIILFVPAMGLLLFEVSRVFEKQPDPSVTLVPSFGRKISVGNLNRSDPRTRAVHGGRERCLKILPPEELEHLEIPSVESPSFPIDRIEYVSGTDGASIYSNADLIQHHTNATRFNLFTGYQTILEREQSYKVNETAVVHCGFYSENGGFKITDEDKRYMQSCEVVVSTCAFGGGDDLYQPIGMSETSLRKVCYVAFWDEITRKTQESEGHIIGEDEMIGKWRIVVVRQLPFMDQRLNGKIPKMLGHRLFPQARYSIWVDSKSQFRRDPLGVLEALLWRMNAVLAISEHGARSSIYDEGKAVVKKHKATPEEVEVQLSQYRHDGFPDEKRFNGKKALAEASVIVREHTPLTNLFMCLWFNEVVRFTSRDQLSFPFVLRQLRVLKNVNMFPVCTRKDMVNSMGHTRKARSQII